MTALGWIGLCIVCFPILIWCVYFMSKAATIGVLRGRDVYKKGKRNED